MGGIFSFETTVFRLLLYTAHFLAYRVLETYRVLSQHIFLALRTKALPVTTVPQAYPF